MTDWQGSFTFELFFVEFPVFKSLNGSSQSVMWSVLYTACQIPDSYEYILPFQLVKGSRLKARSFPTPGLSTIDGRLSEVGHMSN